MPILAQLPVNAAIEASAYYLGLALCFVDFQGPCNNRSILIDISESGFYSRPIPRDTSAQPRWIRLTQYTPLDVFPLFARAVPGPGLGLPESPD